MNKRWIGLPVAIILLTSVMVAALCLEGEAASRQKPAVKSRKAEPVTAPPPATAFSAADVVNCKGCHQTYADSINDPKMLAGKHKTVGDCFTCHVKADLEKIHTGVTKAPGKLFRQRKYPDELCLNCHDGYEKLAEKTRESKVFTTVDGKVINPHNVAALGGTHAGKTECSNCHKMHKDKPPIEYCYGCHHPRQLNNCKDCHSKKG